MCQVLKVSRSGYYAWMKHAVSPRTIENQILLLKIEQVHTDSKKIYGSPTITKELNRQGVKVSRPRVARLMRKARLRSIVKKKFKATTNSKHKYPVVENKLNRAFNPKEIGTAWVSDITYIKTRQGWMYLTIVLDLGDRKIIGWALSKTMKAEDTVIPAWKMAETNRPIIKDLIFHSDRGIQYACNDFKRILEANPLVCRSMSRKGDCWDNAVAESFFKTLKAECIYQNKFRDREQAALVVFEYLEIWYNRKRLHSALGYMSPEEYSKKLSKQYLTS